MYFFAFGFSFLGSILSSPLTDRFGNKNVLLISSVLPIIFQVLSVLSNGFLSGILLTIGSLSWGVRWPIISHMTNIEIKSENRATLLSIAKVVNFIGFSFFSPLFGYLIDIYNINLIYFIGALLSFGLLLIYLRLEDK